MTQNSSPPSSKTTAETSESLQISELVELGLGSSRIHSIRIPELSNVAFSDRVALIVDHPAFQRLRRIRQLGSAHLVYPGAVHTRFEHSLGVLGTVGQFLNALLKNATFRQSATETDLLTVLAAGLLHDIGHYPFAHSLEALHLKGREGPHHEKLGSDIIRGNIAALRGKRPLSAILAENWKVDPERVIGLCTGSLGNRPTQMDTILRSIMSSALDADKMDYLERDSIHLGVPYGRNYDRKRLLNALTLNEKESSVAIEAKGKVSAEIFVFGRYTMFSEVYWHHTVRATAAMVEAAIDAFQSRGEATQHDLKTKVLEHDDDGFLRWLYASTPDSSATRYLLEGMVGLERRLFKRVLTLSRSYKEERKRRAYETIYEMDATTLYSLTDRIRVALSIALGLPLHPADIIIDTPPRDKDRLEEIEVVYPGVNGRQYYRLHELSRIVAGIQNDFVKVVKKIRFFAHPNLAKALQNKPEIEELILDEILKSR